MTVVHADLKPFVKCNLFIVKMYLSELIVGPIILFDVMLLQPDDGIRVVDPLEGPLGGLEVLGRMERKKTGHISTVLSSCLAFHHHTRILKDQGNLNLKKETLFKINI